MTDTTTATQSGTTEATPQQQPAGFTQEQVNSFLADERRKWEAKQKEAADKAKAEAEAKAAAARGEFEQLAQQRQQALEQLTQQHTTAQERLTALEAEIVQQTEARLKALPKEIAEMKPETDDPLIVYRWLGRAEQAAAKLTQQKSPPAGTPPGPRNGGSNPTVGAGGDTVARKKASNDYSF